MDGEERTGRGIEALAWVLGAVLLMPGCQYHVSDDGAGDDDVEVYRSTDSGWIPNSVDLGSAQQ